MKFQDIIFIFLFIFLLYKRNFFWASWAGMIFLVASIPLFAGWVFFTAERFTWYAAAFFLLSILLQRFLLRKKPE